MFQPETEATGNEEEEKGDEEEELMREQFEKILQEEMTWYECIGTFAGFGVLIFLVWYHVQYGVLSAFWGNIRKLF